VKELLVFFKNRYPNHYIYACIGKRFTGRN